MNNLAMVKRDGIIKPYAIYDSNYMLSGVELYSGGENDPIVDAALYAEENLAFDASGGRLPFSLQVGMPAQDIDREVELLEDKGRVYRRWDQKICVTVIVWSCMDDYMFFESSESSWGEII